MKLTAAELRLVGVTKSYGSHRTTAPAVADIDVTVAAGSTLAILGPSGCGKSTILRLVAGIEAPDEGTITLGDRELSRPGAAVDPDRRGINMVFQNYALWPHLRVADIIGYGLAHGRHRVSMREREHRVDELVELMQLGGLERRRPAELSGGQQQRVAIARALATAPSLLLFDEPLSNLDVQLRATMRDELSVLLRRLGTTVVYVTHDVTEALALADRILVLDSGRAVQCDTAEAVFRRPATPWVATMAGFSSRLTPHAIHHGENGARAIIGDHMIVGQSCGDGDDGQPAVYVHPDAVTLLTNTTDRTLGRLSGVIRSCVYEGRGHRVTVDVPGAGHVTAPSTSTVPVGATVSLAIDPDGVLVYGAPTAPPVWEAAVDSLTTCPPAAPQAQRTAS